MWWEQYFKPGWVDTNSQISVFQVNRRIVEFLDCFVTVNVCYEKFLFGYILTDLSKGFPNYVANRSLWPESNLVCNVP